MTHDETDRRDASEVSPEDLFERVDRGDPVSLLDVRDEDEYEKWRIEGPSVEAMNVPAPRFDQVIDEVRDRFAKDDQIVVVCAKGLSSDQIASWLRGEGYDAVNLAEGMEGWARLYHAVEIERYDGSGTVYQYQRPSSGCLGYLLVDGDEAAVFDPLDAFVDRYLADVDDLDATLSYAFDTHIHADHISGLRDLVAEGVEGVLSDAAADRGVTYSDEISTVSDGETFTVGAATIEVVSTPGHTSGMTSYLLDGSVLVTGDGIFAESIARPDLEAGADGAATAARQLYDSIQNVVLSLGDEVVVAGGHYSGAAEPATDGTYTATIGDLRESMTLLSADEDEFVEGILADMPPRPSNYQQIIRINLGQESVTETEAFMLELGPNNCATSTDALTVGR